MLDKGKDKAKNQSAHAQFAKIVKHAKLPTIYHGFLFLGPAIAGAWHLQTRLITILAGKDKEKRWKWGRFCAALWRTCLLRRRPGHRHVRVTQSADDDAEGVCPIRHRATGGDNVTV